MGPLGYVTDAKTLPAQAMDLFRGVKVLVINALFRTEHPTHLSVPEADHARLDLDSRNAEGILAGWE